MITLFRPRARAASSQAHVGDARAVALLNKWGGGPSRVRRRWDSSRGGQPVWRNLGCYVRRCTLQRDCRMGCC